MSNASPTDLGAGQQTPNDSASEANVFAFAVERLLARLDTMKPVRVVAVHPGEGSPPGPATVDVQPLVSQLDGNGNAVDQGTVYGIPVARTQGGPWTIICDPAVDQFGYVVAADRDISAVVAQPGLAPPGSPGRRFSISDGVFVGAVLNPVGDSYLWLREDGSFKLAAAGGFVLETDASGNATATVGTKMTVVGNLDVTGEITKGSATPATKVTLGGHFHAANNTPPTPGH